jgi:hypothetical protein
VQRKSKRVGVCAALLLAAMLAGCANPEIFESGERWFSRPFHVVSSNGGYTYSELKETARNRPITANDLVSASGGCPPPAEPTPAPQASAAPGASPAAAAPSLLGEGIALGMSECDVVHRVGTPTHLQLGTDSRGERTVVMSYDSGVRPGIYRFKRGRLTEMNDVQTASTPKREVAKRTRRSRESTGQTRISTE